MSFVTCLYTGFYRYHWLKYLVHWFCFSILLLQLCCAKISQFLFSILSTQSTEIIFKLYPEIKYRRNIDLHFSSLKIEFKPISIFKIYIFERNSTINTFPFHVMKMQTFLILVPVLKTYICKNSPTGTFMIKFFVRGHFQCFCDWKIHLLWWICF